MTMTAVAPVSRESDIIPLVDLRRQHDNLRAEIQAAIDEVVADSSFIGGPAVDAFAAAFARFCGVEHCIPCCSGTEALRLAIVAALGPGDGRAEIITVSHTFAATAEAIVAAGYAPVFVDVEPKTYLMDLSQLTSAVTLNTAAVVPVHLYGRMVDMPRLRHWADRQDVVLIEDAAQAHGAEFAGCRPGQCSRAAAFSFYPGKNLGAWGDAGAVVTRDADLAERIAQLADHGRCDKFTHLHVGANARMDAVQAAVLHVKLKYLNQWNDARRRAARAYDQRLAAVPACTTPPAAEASLHAYHQYVVQVPNRDAVRDALHARGIAAGIHYPVPVHEQPAYRFLGYPPHALPRTHDLCRNILSLPMFPEITPRQIERVADAVRDAVGDAVADALAAR
jgi:dTDP-4-amino-4,6-dideoxygalactose transaminase